MARKKKEVELTPEEKLAQEKERGLSHIKNEIPHINEPTYRFNIGDKVSYGALKEAVVDEIFYDGKVYGLKCIAVENNYGRPYEHEVYRVTTWTEVRPLANGDTNFAENQNLRIHFNNSTVESLIRKHYFFGVDFDPEYQRGYVWSPEDKELLIDSVFRNIDIGKFVFVKVPDDEWSRRQVLYEILDGKQRLSTFIEFYENRITYKGKYFNELSGTDKGVFLRHSVSFAEIDSADKKTILKHFLMLNRTGKAMDEIHLQKVEEMLRAL